MTRYFIAVTVVLTLIISLAQASQAEMFYSKPAFRGRLIDADTRQPVDGAVAVVLYYKRSTFSLNPGGPSAFITKAKEMLTDKRGEFYFPAYRELMWLNEAVGTRFIFYKPGYMVCYGSPSYIVPDLEEKYFSSDVVGQVAEIVNDYGRPASYKGPLGIVELKKGEGDPSVPHDYRSDKLPLLFRALNEDRRNRGYKGELK